MKKAALLGAFAVLLVLLAGLLLQLPGGTNLARPTILAEMPPTPPPPPTPTQPPFTRIAEVEDGEGPTLSWRPSRMEGLDPLPGLDGGDQLFFDGKEFILTYAGRIFTSRDGDVWSEIPLQFRIAGRPYTAVAARDDLLLVSTSLREVIAFEKSSASETRISLDFPMEGIRDLRTDLAVGPRGALVVFFSSSFVKAAFFSPDGRDWTRIETQPFNSQYGGLAAFAGGFLYRERSGQVWFSPDGLNWTDRFAGGEKVSDVPGGFVPWKEGVLAVNDNVFIGPTISNGPYTFLDMNGKRLLPDSELPPLEGEYIGISLGVSAGPAGILAVFGWDPHIYVQPPGGCCKEGQALGVVEFSADGTTWTRRQFPGSLYWMAGNAAGTDRFLVLGFNHEEPTAPLWIGFP